MFENRSSVGVSTHLKQEIGTLSEPGRAHAVVTSQIMMLKSHGNCLNLYLSNIISS